MDRLLGIRFAREVAVQMRDGSDGICPTRPERAGVHVQIGWRSRWNLPNSRGPFPGVVVQMDSYHKSFNPNDFTWDLQFTHSMFLISYVAVQPAPFDSTHDSANTEGGYNEPRNSDTRPCDRLSKHSNLIPHMYKTSACPHNTNTAQHYAVQGVACANHGFRMLCHGM